MLGGLSMTEIIIILGLALLLLGPDQLPSLAKSLGKGLRELRKATDDLKGQFESEVARLDLNEQPAKIAPVPPPPDAAAAGSTPDAAAMSSAPPAVPDDPGAARAAARRAAAAAAQLKLISPEGTVPRAGGELVPPPAPAEEPK